MNTIRQSATIGLLLLAPAIAFSAGNAANGQNKSAVCHACHGATGVAVQSIYPSLGGQHQNYLSKSIRAFRSGERQNAIMAPMVANLSDVDIEDIAAWYASQQGLTEIKDK